MRWLAAFVLVLGVTSSARAQPFTATGSMRAARADHQATLLLDGRVLVVGGTAANPCAANATAEVFDPATADWSAVELVDIGTPQESACADSLPRDSCPPGSTSTMLPDGRVLVAGGSSASGRPLPAAELFDVFAGRRTLVGSLNTARTHHTATRLANGTILIAGGNDGVTRTATAEIYLPEISYTSRPFGIARPAWMTTGQPWSVATNSQGHVLISNGSSQRTRLFEWVRRQAPIPDYGQYFGEIGGGLEMFAHAIRIDRDDNIWAVDGVTHSIYKWNARGEPLAHFFEPAEPGKPLDDAYVFDTPTDIALDAAGESFVADAGRDRVTKYDAEGRFVASAGSPGSGPGQMQRPHSIVADADGNIYVADGGNARIEVFDNGLNLRAVYSAVGSPWALCITRGGHQYLYAASNPDRSDTGSANRAGEIYKLELDGTIVGTIVAATTQRAFSAPSMQWTAVMTTRSSPLVRTAWRSSGCCSRPRQRSANHSPCQDQ